MFDAYWPEISAFFQVLFIDIVLAGDNAVVVGMAAAGVPREIRRKVILVGIGLAVALRIFFAIIATQLLAIVGLTLTGGILLLWVCWKMYREIVTTSQEEEEAVELTRDSDSFVGEPHAPQKTFRKAVIQILVADVSMSLDNVLAVAGAAMNHPYILVGGLLLSVAFMGAAASLIAGLLARFRWIAWIGLVIILYVAIEMIWHGAHSVLCAATTEETCKLGIDGYLWSVIFAR
jgi:YjbE family integral membrane protein